jgi:hypothetical protein
MPRPASRLGFKVVEATRDLQQIRRAGSITERGDSRRVVYRLADVGVADIVVMLGSLRHRSSPVTFAPDQMRPIVATELMAGPGACNAALRMSVSRMIMAPATCLEL